jgi:steroid delta-isomerase-like uncharacterized protein
MEGLKNNNQSEQNKNLIRGVVDEIWNGGNFDKIEELVTDDFVIHASRPGNELKGAKQVKEFYTKLHEAFPDIKFTIMDQIAEDDKVVTHFKVDATHKGEFNGIPATGKKVSFTGIDIDRISNGKFVECWTKMDELGLIQQLGVVPAK